MGTIFRWRKRVGRTITWSDGCSLCFLREEHPRTVRTRTYMEGIHDQGCKSPLTIESLLLAARRQIFRNLFFSAIYRHDRTKQPHQFCHDNRSSPSSRHSIMMRPKTVSTSTASVPPKSGTAKKAAAAAKTISSPQRKRPVDGLRQPVLSTTKQRTVRGVPPPTGRPTSPGVEAHDQQTVAEGTSLAKMAPGFFGAGGATTGRYAASKRGGAAPNVVDPEDPRIPSVNAAAAPKAKAPVATPTRAIPGTPTRIISAPGTPTRMTSAPGDLSPGKIQHQVGRIEVARFSRLRR